MHSIAYADSSSLKGRYIDEAKWKILQDARDIADLCYRADRAVYALTGMLRMGKIGFQPDDGNDDACTGEVQVYAMYRLP